MGLEDLVRGLRKIGEFPLITVGNDLQLVDNNTSGVVMSINNTASNWSAR